MRDLDAAEVTAILARAVVARDFVWVTAKDRTTGAAVSVGLWSGNANVTTDVQDALTGADTSRLFIGSGAMVSIGAIPLTADITVRTVDVVLSQIHATAELIVRGYDVRGGPIQIYRGYLDPDTRALVAVPKPRFVGYVDGAPIETPSEGGEGSITLRCVSTTRELTRANPDVRSHESQIARASGDLFLKDAAVVGEWELAWGQKRGKPAGGSRDDK